MFLLYPPLVFYHSNQLILLYISLERERPSSPFIKMLQRKPSGRSPNGSINGRSASPATHTRRAMSLDIPRRDFVNISDLSKGEVVYTTTRLSNGNSNSVRK